MTIDEILQKATDTVLSVTRKALKSKDKEIKGVSELYEDCVEMYERIEVHAVKGEFPDKLFENRSPNQTEKETTYIKKNYKQYTLPEFVDYINTITRPFGDGNWSIKYAEDAQEFKDNSFQTYVEKELPIYKSLEQFVKTVLPTLKTIDANGFIGIRPMEIELVTDGENTFISNELVKPAVLFYESDAVIDYVDGEYFLFLSDEKSVVKYNGTSVKDGNVFELYTKDEVYFIRQIGDKIKNEYEVELFYSHNLGKIPVIQTKGIPQLVDGEILWQSPFLFGVDLLDLVAVNSNWLQFSINKCVFPMVVMYGDECTFRDANGAMCADGRLLGVENGTAYNVSCPSCNGSGIKGRLSPLGTLLIKPTTTLKEGEVNASQPPLSYVSPSTESLEFLEKKIDKDTIKARQILKLRNRNSIVTGQPITATEVFDDAKSMSAFIKPIIDQIFEIYEFCLEMIGKQRYGDKFVEPELVYPKSFDFKNAEDYLKDLTDAISSKLPPAFIQSLLFQYVSAYYGDNERTTKIYKLIVNADRIFALSQDEINMKLAKGTIAKWEDILHTSIMNFITEQINLDENFLDKDLQVQVDILQTKAKDVEASINDESMSQIYTPPPVN